MQLVQEPTHKQGNILDLVFSNEPDSVSTPTIDSSYDGKSDHYVITFHVTTPNRLPPPAISARLNYAKADLNGLQSYLLDNDLEHCLSTSDTNLIWSHIKNSILNACHLYIPVLKHSHFQGSLISSLIRVSPS